MYECVPVVACLSVVYDASMTVTFLRSGDVECTLAQSRWTHLVSAAPIPKGELVCTRPHFPLCSDLLECRPRGGPAAALSAPLVFQICLSSSVGAKRTNSPSRDDIATLRTEKTVAEQYRSVRSSSLRDEQGNTTVHHYPWCQWSETVPQLRAPFGERYSQLEATLPVQPNARQKPGPGLRQNPEQEMPV